MTSKRSPQQQEIERRTGRDIVELLTEMRYERLLTADQIAAELSNVAESRVAPSTVKYWFPTLGIARHQLREKAEQEDGREPEPQEQPS